MKFLDQVKVHVASGKGGNGCVSFRREKYVEYGGPDGGNGGKGSDIIFETNKNLNTLIDFRYQQHFKGKNGEAGKGQNKTGSNAKNIIIKIPKGTQILTEDKSVILSDMTEDNQKFTIVKGGKGGLGNSHFKSSTNRAPRQHTKGQDSEKMWVWLSLKLIADVGIIGLPNAGKSTLLSKISSAHPKIANYPFTTLYPVLGVVRDDDYEFVVADIPGLIEGAHEGKGLGDKFLAHIERCKILLHLVDSGEEKYINNYDAIRLELKKYGNNLLNKKEIVALSKVDNNDNFIKLKEEMKRHTKNKIITISSNNNIGLDELIRETKRELMNETNKSI
tara:strand:- start:96 stop:1094 length:999 start_codon:yes stop_codon:yes gene_type:complete